MKFNNYDELITFCQKNNIIFRFTPYTRFQHNNIYYDAESRLIFKNYEKNDQIDFSTMAARNNPNKLLDVLNLKVRMKQFLEKVKDWT